jgi:uncharacterized radical SAM superfamily Fe-S cluster-containing enzyme
MGRIVNDKLKINSEREKEQGEVARTYCGAEIPPLEMGLPKVVPSLCPECLKKIDARLWDENGKVMMEKTCPEHGKFSDVYWGNTQLYLKAEKWSFMEGKGLSNPQVKNATLCPDQCGLCNMHVSHTTMANVDLTNRCDLRCPICFANAAVQGYVYEPSFDEILQMLKTIRDQKPVATNVIQFSGGEPTMHPKFFDVLRAAGEMGFDHIQIATNGINISNLDFARKAKAAGLHTIYLQFDGVSEDIYKKTRGEPLLQTKIKAIENCREVEMMVILVPTIVRTVNDHQVGDILKFALKYGDVIRGISYQPVAFTGRISTKKRMEQRYTMPDVATDIEKQTGLLNAQKDWYPICFTSPFSKFYIAIRGYEIVNLTCHPHCSLATYLLVHKDDPENRFVPITEIMDVEGMLQSMDKLADKTKKARVKTFSKIKAFNYIRKYYRPEKAPAGMTFKDFLDAINGLMDKKLRGKTDWIAFLVAGMHFMDVYNYDINRVRRCVIHYSTPSGQLFPFCTYNGGPCYREKIEKRYSIPLEEYKAKRKSAN